MTRLAANIRTGDWLHRERVVLYLRALVLGECVLFVYFLFRINSIVFPPLSDPTSTDFLSFYTAGHMANTGHPDFVYQPSALYAMERQIAGDGGTGYFGFFYPPVFLLVCALLARMPYLGAFLAWAISTGGLYLLSIRSIVRRQAVLLPAIAFPAAFIALGQGQNSFLTVALLGGATAQIDKRPAIAGVLFGALCYKPHFGLLIPVALVAGGHWRAFASAALTVMALVGLSLLIHGRATWQGFFAIAQVAQSVFEQGEVNFEKLVSPFAAVRSLGGGVSTALAVQAVASTVAAVVVGTVWRRRLSLPVRAMVLCSATLIALPVILDYDLLIASIPMAWMMREALKSGFLPWEKSGLFTVFVLAFLAWPISRAGHVQLGLLISLTLLGLVLARAGREAFPARQTVA